MNAQVLVQPLIMKKNTTSNIKMDAQIARSNSF